MSWVREIVTRRVSIVFGTAVIFVVMVSGVAGADHRAPFDGSMHLYGEMVDYDLVFPVAGEVRLSDTFHARRTNGDHHAQDLMSPKMTPVVAAASGTVKYVNYSRNPDDLRPERCCTIVLTHDDGWESWYLHLNNDSPGTDDGEGWGIAPGILPGTHVTAGQLIGWVGDSGNAEYTGSHLHFELHDPEGVIVNPYESLLAAEAECAGDCDPLVVLARGSEGTQVLHLQTMLAVLGFDPGPPDGSFGMATEAAVVDFQSSEGLDETGAVGPETWTSIVGRYESVVEPPDRLAGANRYETAAAVAADSYQGGADVVFLAVGTNFPDAIAAGPVAAALGAPILLSGQGSVPGPTRDALLALDPDTVILLGGPQAIGTSVQEAVAALLPGASVQRLAGQDRYDTAVEISRFGFPSGASVVYVTTGANFADALVAGPAASTAGAALLIVPRDVLPTTVASELRRLGPEKIVIVGGTASVSSTVAQQLADHANIVERRAGANRYSTAARVTESAFGPGAEALYVAVGLDFPDALSGAAAAGRLGAPLLLVGADDVPLDVVNEVRRLSPARVVVLGGPAAVTDRVAAIVSGLYATSPTHGGSDVVYDPSAGAEQWLPLVEDVFARWGLDVEKCGTGDRATDCIGPQVENAIVIMECESGGDPEAVNSYSGTTGLFQHRPSYWSTRVERVRARFPDFPVDASALDPEHNVMVAALLVDESRDALIGENSLTGPWDDGPEPWGHWDSSSRYCADPPLVSP